ncbi:hypothetical protein [Bradyrhizobium sp. CER78]|uniref:hypothetical protein n=1 Tax=Bradyrhizobium sp. CER78 TaxID=3039162 RepID=UPI002449FAE7|nr:hypothetical protein [Bradyrhizobium sp. CER78]MDH2381901.1 hypothetical protein [Bradyrhizobium sp. CER78]
MDFDQAAALAIAWVDICCEGRARIVREATITKPYGWIFFYQAKEFLDHGIPSTSERSLPSHFNARRNFRLGNLARN